MKKKLRLMMTMLLLAVMGSAWAAEKVNTCTVSTKFSDTGNVTSNFTQTGDFTEVEWNLGVTWKSSSYWGNIETKGSQIGSGSKPATQVILRGSNISETIKSVKVNTAMASGGTITVGVVVGSTVFVCGESNTANLQTASSDYTFTGTGTGDIVITWNQPSTSKAIYIKSVTITTDTGGSQTETYTVTYDCNEGTSGCPEDLTEVKPETVITLADAPTKTDYTFGGWSDGTTIYDPGDEYEVIGDVTLTAQWTFSGVDYVTLPYNWEGGSKSELTAVNGISANGLGSDYASGNAPYLVKFDNTGDYILIKTNERPGKVTIDVKMIGGSTTSTITVQGSQDGETFTDVQTLTISGAQNAELTLETINIFDENDRYVKLLFTKGSNVGVGPFSIAKYTEPEPVDPEVSFEEETITLKVGKSYTNPINMPSNLTVTYSVTAGSEFASVNPSTGEVTGLSVGQAIITASWEAVGNIYNAGSKYYIVNVIENVVEEFEKVLDVAKLYDGLEIIFVNEDAQKTMGAQGGNNFGATGVELDLENTPYVTLLPDGATVLTLKKGEGNTWYFLTPDNKYLYAASSSSNHLKTTTDSQNAKATIVIDDDGNVEIKFQGSYTHNTIRYNSTNDLFSCYTTGQNPVQIYSNKTFEKVSFGTSGYKTYVTANAIDWTATKAKGVEGYQVTTFSTTEVILEELDGNITAPKTPVILKGVEGKNCLVIADENGSDVSSTNQLKRGSERKESEKNFMYVLQKSNNWSEENPYDEYNFYPLRPSRWNDIGDRQAYLVLATAPGGGDIGGETGGPGLGVKPIPIKFINANDDEPLVSDDAGLVDGINDIQRNEAIDGEFYSISGVRVAAPTKGLYIVNGKKVLVK